MRHGKKFNHLGRQKPHREAMLANMACSLIEHKKVNTTVAKAKALKKYVEPLITKSKVDSTHSRRVVFSYLKNKHAVSELFRDISTKVADRPGGYTRILKTGFRLGDNAQMCLIELVDYNENMLKDAKTKKSSRRRRGGSKSAKKKEQVVAAEETISAQEVSDVVEDVVEVVEETTEKAEETVSAEEVSDTVEDVVETVEETVDAKEEETAEKIEEAVEEKAETKDEVKAEAESDDSVEDEKASTDDAEEDTNTEEEKKD